MGKETLEMLYQCKKNAVIELLKLTTEMSKTIGTEQVHENELIDFLAKRQELMSQVDELDKQIALFDTSQTKQIQDIKVEIKDLIKEIIDLDAQYKEDLSKAQVFVKGKIKDVTKRKQVKQAYYPRQNQNNGYFIDNKK
ncbi:hypothetical protein JCM14036_15000 [Desulfotomaculum defluvii]